MDYLRTVRLWGPFVLAGSLLVLGPAWAPADAASARAAAQPRWSWPLDPRPQLARPFEQPSRAWSAGHRGVDLRPSGGPKVYAVEAGVVSHVGVIAGRPTISVQHADGLRSTYEPVASELHLGDTVSAGQDIGTLVDPGSHCSPAACLHLGAIRNAAYLDPMLLLRPIRVILKPLSS